MQMRKPWVSVIVASLLCHTGGVASAQSAVEQGLVWLDSQQRPDGTWASDERLVLRDTAEALRVYAAFAPEAPAFLALLDV